MKLENTFSQFVKDMKKFDPKIIEKHYSFEEIIMILNQHFLNNQIENIEFLNIGKIYKTGNEGRKKTIENHINQIAKCYESQPETKEERKDIDLIEGIMGNPLLFWQNNIHLLPILAKLIITDDAKEMCNELVEKYSGPDIQKGIKDFVNNEEDFNKVFKFILNMLETLKNTLKV